MTVHQLKIPYSEDLLLSLKSTPESFEAQAKIPVLGKKPFPLVFIRAPVIVELGERVEPLAEYGGKTILARQGNILVATFHPELTEDSRLHEYFVGMVGSSETLTHPWLPS